MKIEIAPKEYHIRCTFDEARFYCFNLDIAGKGLWRLPTKDEWERYSQVRGWATDEYGRVYHTNWATSHRTSVAGMQYQSICTPVRDL